MGKSASRLGENCSEGNQCGGEEQGGEEVADGDLFHVQQAEAEGQQDDAACGGQRVDLGDAQDVAGEVADDRPAALDERDGGAIVTGITSIRGTAAGSPFAAEFRFTDTWVRSGNGWALAASHASALPR